MISVFLAFSSVIVDAGLKQALIRKLEVTQLEYSTAFYANVSLGIVLYSVLYFIAPLIADFYNQPVLIDLVRVSGITVFINSLSMVQETILHRDLNFKVQLRVSLPAAIISGFVAILLAYEGYGVWALVVQVLLSSVLVCIFYWLLNIWRPTFEYSWFCFNELLKFGGYILVAQMINIPYRNMYVIVLAKFFSPSVAGGYFFAEKIKTLLLSQLVDSINNVTYPALAQIQDDNKKLKEGYRRVISVTTFLFFPCVSFLAALAEPLFLIFLPAEWYDSIQYLQLMCVAALLYPLHSFNLNILKIKGRPDLVLYLGLFKKTIAIIIFVIALRYGVVGILVGQIINSVVSYFPNMYFSNKLINYSFKEQMQDALPSLFLSLFLGLAIYAATLMLHWRLEIELVVFSLLGLTFYLFGSYVLKIKGYSLAIQIVGNKLTQSDGRL